MFNDTTYNPAAIAAETEIRATKRKPIDGRATTNKSPSAHSPTVNPIAEGQKQGDYRAAPANCNPIHDDASLNLKPTSAAPHRETSPEILDVIAQIDRVNRRRKEYIKAKIRMINSGKAQLRLAIGAAKFLPDMTDDDRKKMRDETDKAWAAATKPENQNYEIIAPMLGAIAVFDDQQALCEKEMVKLVKLLPVYDWVKSVNGFGDVSFATVVGECGDIGSYRNPSCIWKRMGLAPFEGKAGATWRKIGGLSAEQWIAAGYSPKRRSVAYNLDKIIGGMGLWRPLIGSDLTDANYYQRVFAERARIEAVKLEMPVTESDKGKESYTKYVSTRAMRYTQKRLLRELWRAWRDA